MGKRIRTVYHQQVVNLNIVAIEKKELPCYNKLVAQGSFLFWERSS